MKKKRCIMLYDDVHGMGHLPFFKYLCESLQEDFHVSILLGNNLSFDCFPGAEVIKIGKKSNRELRNVTRLTQIEDALFKTQPDIFFVDFFPFGRYGNILEINLITSFVKNKGGKNISIMRDIYLGKKILSKHSYQKFTSLICEKKNKDIFTIIETDYRWFFDIIFKSNTHHIFLIQSYLQYTISKNIISGILVFGDKKIFDISEEFILNTAEKNIFHHIGYIPSNSITKSSYKKSKKSILISTGGNVTSKKDFKDLILYMKDLEGYSIRILLGPYIEREYKKEIISLVYGNKNISVTGFVSDFNELLHTSSYFFGFGGYGTFQNLFQYQGKAFIMSNYDDKDFKHRYYEQKYRTIHLQEYLNVTFLNDFSTQALDICMKLKSNKILETQDIEFCSSVKLMEAIDTITKGEK